MTGGGAGGGGGGGKGGAAAGPVPAASRKLVQSLKEIVNRPEAEIYAALRDCGMDPDEAVSRLLSQGLRPLSLSRALSHPAISRLFRCPLADSSLMRPRLEFSSPLGF